MRSAVVTMLKDEASDIAYWISWYISIGFDTVIIFDDNSTDDTAQIIIDAGTVYDVRYISVAPNTDRALVRQLSCYGEAVRSYKDEFDWMAFFDGDEYLSLPENIDVNSFLSRFNNADAIAVHWCNYGSNGHIVKPSVPSFAAFTRHGRQDEWDHRHVKSIVRPGVISGDVVNAHSVDVPTSRYLLPNGTPVQWENEAGGFTLQNATWENAKLMHFPVRSMEHFVERCRRREARSGMADRVFFSGDFDLIEDLAPLSRFPRFNDILFQIVRKISVSIVEKTSASSTEIRAKPYHLEKLINSLAIIGRRPRATPGRKNLGLSSTVQENTVQAVRSYEPAVSNSEHFRINQWISPSRDLLDDDKRIESLFANSPEYSESAGFRVFTIETFFGSTLVFNKDHPKIIHAKKDQIPENSEAVYGVIWENIPNIIVLFTGKTHQSLLIEGDERIVAFQAMRVQTYGGGRVSIQHPRTGRFLCAAAFGHGRETGDVAIDRWRANNWESFTLRQQLDWPKAVSSIISSIGSLDCDELKLLSIPAILKSLPKEMVPEVFPVLLATMGSRELSAQASRIGISLPHLIY